MPQDQIWSHTEIFMILSHVISVSSHKLLFIRFTSNWGKWWSLNNIVPQSLYLKSISSACFQLNARWSTKMLVLSRPASLSILTARISRMRVTLVAFLALFYILAVILQRSNLGPLIRGGREIPETQHSSWHDAGKFEIQVGSWMIVFAQSFLCGSMNFMNLNGSFVNSWFGSRINRWNLFPLSKFSNNQDTQNLAPQIRSANKINLKFCRVMFESNQSWRVNLLVQ